MRITLPCLFIATVVAVGAAPVDTKDSLVDRVDRTGFIQVYAESFRDLTPRQQELCYWLTQAAIAIDPIIYDQLSTTGLREKRLLEEIVAHGPKLDPVIRPQIEAYAKLFWANRGNHNLQTAEKFVPHFDASALHDAALAAQRDGAFHTNWADLPPFDTPALLEAELSVLTPAIFTADFEPTITAKSPEGGRDIIQASSNTFYENVTLADLKGFKARYGLNSRLVKDPDGKLRENVYRAGTPDGKIPPGLYSVFLNQAVSCLQRAGAVAEPGQSAAIAALIRYYQTGEYSDLLAADAAWVQNNAAIDYASGFIEIYRDANGMKGSAQAFVSITDRPLTTTMTKLAENAAYFEARAPWLDQYKKTDFRAPLVKAVEILAETGDFEVITIGDNLPNENEIREKYGSKNFLFTASSRAIKAAVGQKSNEEFAPSPEVAARLRDHGDAADELLTALHEVIGHGSGKLSARLKGGSEAELKEYFSTLEEARADLMALWNVWDPKLKELGLVTDQEQEAKAMYDRAALNIIVQLRQIPHGDTIEEDHLRNRALITNYIMDRTHSIETFTRDGKAYVRVTDYQKMRQGVGELLAEIMRIKAEGDYAAIKGLVDKYAVHFDPAVRDQVVARYGALGAPTYFAGINPQLTARMSATGKVESVEISYPRDPIRQYLAYGAMYLGK